jgi:oxygen-independent coproporphyrinogen-3 oxidase
VTLSRHLSPASAAAGLYVHIPFCSVPCPYCDFAKVAGNRQRHDRFVEHLLQEIEGHADCGELFDTIYFGGGTPSVLAVQALARIVERLDARLSFTADRHIYLEANPEDVAPSSLAAWRALGVRTLSLGVQSFHAGALRFLGRRHDPDQARRSVKLAREAGFETLSLDLIYGLPAQRGFGVAAWRQTLEEAVRLAPDHFSCYQLSLNPETPFGRRQERGELVALPERAQAEQFFLTHRLLRDAGYPGYEVSSFARSPAHRSRHNQKYWRHVPYLGLGPSAHSFLGGRRRWNVRELDAYQARIAAGESAVAGEETLSRDDLALETLMLGLRTYAGVDLERFAERFGTDLLASNRPLVERLAAEELVTLDGDRLVPTLRGLAVADGLASCFRLDIDCPVGMGSSRERA